MQPEAIASLFSALIIVGLVGGFTLFAVPSTRSKLVAAAPSLAALVALGAMFGSLYFSELAGFVPCDFCWYQRIAMYPLAVILPLAALRRDRDVVNYVFVLAAAGFVLSLYHVQMQLFPDRATSCSIDDPCTAKWVEGLGVFTIPQMAGASFFLIIMLCIASTFGRHQESEVDVESDRVDAMTG